MSDTPKSAPAKTLPCFGCGKPIVFQSNGVWGHASSSDALECPMGVTQPAPATPAATPLRFDQWYLEYTAHYDSLDDMDLDQQAIVADIAKKAWQAALQLAASPAATPLREANQQRVDAAAQRVRQTLYKCPADDPFRKDVELLIEIALAPVLEIFAAAQPQQRSPECAECFEKEGSYECLGH